MIVIVGLVVVIVHHKRRSNEIFVEFANVSCAKCLRKRHIESDANVLGCRHVVCNDCLKGEHACPVCTSDLSDFVSVVKPLRAPQLQVLSAAEVDDVTLTDCSSLFCNHYGTWQGTNERVRLSPLRLRREYLSDPMCGLALIKAGEVLVGHAFFKRFDFDPLGSVCWITQLVVHPQSRNHGCAKALIGKAAETCRFIALVTSHPHAVKAMESVANGSCQLSTMQQWGSQLIKASDIAYLQTAVLKVSETESLVDTRFNVEHTEALEALAKVPAWSLGHSLPDGHEFLAIVEKRSY